MKDMYDTLAKLQEVLARMFEIEDKIKEIPKTLQDKEAVLQKTKISYLELHENCEKTAAECDSLKNRYEEAVTKRTTCEKMMETITQAREFETLQKEIEDAKKEEQNLRKNLLFREKLLDELKMKLDVQKEIVDAQSEEVQQETEVMDKLVEENQTVLEAIKKEEEEIAKDLDPNFLFKFKRIIRNKGGVGIVPIHHEVCEGCHMMLPKQFVNDVRREEEICFCPYCSRVVFYEESEEHKDASENAANFDREATEDIKLGEAQDIGDESEFGDL